MKKISLGVLIASIPTRIASEDNDMPINEYSFKSLNEISDFLKVNKSNLLAKNTKGDWGLGKVFAHCAQSIEYSLGGYPENKSRIFQWTAGSIAFFVFSLRGKMSHGLSEPIPGATTISNETSIEEGIKLLEQAIQKFQVAEDVNLKPHFAYGNLDKKDYDYAHTLHINNHLEELS
ncbi:DUF1569 domain-containing protein [Leptospira sp. GIMC2001]|uniref:DUF1569 domain-containing protein n=1 Tax=Leptospira sp. GIMC2001 TaxID=1513297 RepID=UPI002349E6BF|nr:DUF1569 domain-containing protein [Leptospira sp. GIMC2001]WCL50057.1 DUF1569 domain-containing protein [Leptospira sp. GIMC2001]